MQTNIQLQPKQIKNKNNSKPKTNIQKNSLLLKELISNSVSIQNYNQSTCFVSNFGYYVALFDGVSLSETSNYEVIFPSSADLSLTQNRGFSIFFWCLFKKSTLGVYRYILKKGPMEELTLSVGVFHKQNDSCLSVKLYTSKNRQETLYSTKTIEYDRLYNIVITFEIDYNNELTDIALYIDGLLDCQLTVPGEPLHNHGSLVIGKPDSLNYGYNGWLADLIILPSVLYQNDILEIGNQCLRNIYTYRNLKSYEIIEYKLEYIKLIDRYSEISGIPKSLLSNMKMTNENYREIMKRHNVKFDDSIERKTNNNTGHNQKYTHFRGMLGDENTLLCISAKSFYTYIGFIYTIVHLACNEQEDFEIKRLFLILETLSVPLNIHISYEELYKIMKIMNCIQGEGLFNIDEFFNSYKIYMSNAFSDLSLAVYIGKERNGSSFKSSIQHHEKLLLNNNHTFNNIDIIEQKDLGKTNFSIKTVYSRGVSSKSNLKNNYNEMKDGSNVGNDNHHHSSSNRVDRQVQVQAQAYVQIQERTSQVDENKVIDDEKDNVNIEIGKDKESSNTKEEIIIKNDKIQIDNNNNITNITNTYTNIDDERKNDIKPIKIQPKYPEDWNQGEFELIINRCYNCHLHKTTTKHMEYQYIEKFNEIGNQIKTVFPNIKILGNYYSLEYFGAFDVYIRGISPMSAKDNEGNVSKYCLFNKKEKKKFPSSYEITDKLIALSLLYGGSMNLEVRQTSFINNEDLSVQSKDMHDYPCDIPAEAEEHKTQIENIELAKKSKNNVDKSEKTKYVCLNWACTKGIFTRSENNDSACTYHPGVFQFGSYHAYWPEAWSCCEKEWGAAGCVTGRHRAVKHNQRIHLCLNIGEQNPNTGRPNSACGVYYKEGDSSGCQIHPGYLKGKRFTCCGREGQGCLESSHSTAYWPDEKAKLYFYPKIMKNPGLFSHDKKKESSENLIGSQICKSGLFKASKPYNNPRTKYDLLILKREKEKTDFKICLNWGCGRQFKDVEEENLQNSCRCHPGKYDHGSTGTKMRNYISEMKLPPNERKTILYEPHWTCCRGQWESLGCRMMNHRGVFKDEYEEKKLRPYNWPDIRAKLYFEKVISDKWKESLKRYIYSYQKVKKIFQMRESGWYLNNLPDLCDALKLYLVLINEKPDYHMKFNDVVTNSGTISYFEGNLIKLDKFLKWWFSDYVDLLNEIEGRKNLNSN